MTPNNEALRIQRLIQSARNERSTAPPEEILLSHGLEPLEKPNGSLLSPVPVRCVTCLRVRRVLLNWFTGGGSYHCPHTDDAPPGVGRTSKAEAAQELLAAGLEPKETYPGRVGKNWQARCCECGMTWRVRLERVRKGWRCGHPAGVSSEFCESEPKRRGPA